MTKLARTQGESTDGHTAADVPHWRSALGAGYDVPGLNGPTFSRYADRVSTLKLDAWNRFGLSVRHRSKIDGHKVNFCADVKNVADIPSREPVAPRPRAINSPRIFKRSAVVDC